MQCCMFQRLYIYLTFLLLSLLISKQSKKKKKSEQDLNMFLDILYMLLLCNVLQHPILQ